MNVPRSEYEELITCRKQRQIYSLRPRISVIPKIVSVRGTFDQSLSSSSQQLANQCPRPLQEAGKEDNSATYLHGTAIPYLSSPTSDWVREKQKSLYDHVREGQAAWQWSETYRGSAEFREQTCIDEKLVFMLLRILRRFWLYNQSTVAISLAVNMARGGPEHLVSICLLCVVYLMGVEQGLQTCSRSLLNCVQRVLEFWRPLKPMKSIAIRRWQVLFVVRSRTSCKDVKDVS